MPGYAPIHPIVGAQVFNTLMTPDTTQRWPMGMVMDAVDPYWGFGRFVYGKAVAAQTPGLLVQFDDGFVATALASTANLGSSVFVAAQNFAINTFGWYQCEGMCPIQTSAAVTAGAAVYIGTAGKLTGTLAAGKNVLGVNILQIGTYTITKSNATTVNGSPVIGVSSSNGLFVGLTLSGTGVGSGTIASMDPSGTRVTNTANSTAFGSVTLTGTYTNYCKAFINNPFCQGNIT